MELRPSLFWDADVKTVDTFLFESYRFYPIFGI